MKTSTSNHSSPTKPVGPGFVSPVEAQAQTRQRLFFALATFMGLVAVVALLANLTHKRTDATAPPVSAARATNTPLPSSYTEVLATMINLQGELCAQVTRVERLAKDTYQVDCIRYREGSTTASYEVNARTGAVK